MLGLEFIRFAHTVWRSAPIGETIPMPVMTTGERFVFDEKWLIDDHRNVTHMRDSKTLINRLIQELSDYQHVINNRFKPLRIISYLYIKSIDSIC